jgi:hypothetical protein
LSFLGKEERVFWISFLRFSSFASPLALLFSSSSFFRLSLILVSSSSSTGLKRRSLVMSLSFSSQGIFLTCALMAPKLHVRAKIASAAAGGMNRA